MIVERESSTAGARLVVKQMNTSFNSRSDALRGARLSVAWGPVWILALLASTITSLPAASLAASKLPRPQGFVSDFAEKLSTAERQDLEARLKDFKDRSDGIEVAVVTIPYDWLGSHPLEKYSLRLARSWGIGARGKRKDGVLLLIAIKAPDDQGIYHGSTRLEVSRSLEDDLPS